MSDLSTMTLFRFWLTENRQSWLRPLIVLGVLLMSAVLPLKASQLHFFLILFLLVSLAGLLVVMRWPPLGLLAVVGVSMLVPIDGPGGVNASIVLVALLVGLWLLEMIGQQRQIRLVDSRTMLPMLVFIVITLIAFGVGQLPWFTFAKSAGLEAQIGGLVIFLLSVGAFMVVGHRIRDLDWLKWLTWLFLALAAAIILARLLRFGFIIRRFVHPGMGGSMFWTWLVALGFSQALFNRKLPWFWRLALGTLLLATLYDAAVLNRDWKSGWVPPLVTIAAIIAFRSWRVGLALGVIGALPGAYLILDALASDQYSYSTRLEAWTILAEIIRADPILGLGFANYYWYTPLFRISGYAVEFNSHNNYVDIVAQTGLVGLFGFLWIGWEVGWLGWRLRERVPDGFARAYVYGALGGLVGTLVAAMLGDWVLPFIYNVGMGGFRASGLGWMFMGGLVALEAMYSGQEEPNSSRANPAQPKLSSTAS